MTRLAALGAAFSMATLVAACAGSGADESAPRPRDAAAAPGRALRRVVGSADATSQARTARFTASVQAGRDGDGLRVAADGAIDFVDERLSVTLRARGTADGDDVEGTAETRLVEGVTYFRLGGTGSGGFPDVPGFELPAGTQWVALDVGSAAADLADAFAPTASNPLEDLRALTGASDVEVVGAETVRGVETTHYRATVGRGDRDGLSFDVWLDAHDRVRKYVVGGGDLGLVYELYGFGEPVAIDAPPPEEVATLGDVVGDAVDRFVDELTGA
jgi:hypothetical protein